MSLSKETFHYFAYGSNLLTKRIHFQNPSAVFKDVAKLGGYKLEFRLPSKVKMSKIRTRGQWPYRSACDRGNVT